MIKFNELKKLPESNVKNILDAISTPLDKFRKKIASVSVNVTNFDTEKPNLKKKLQVFITLKNGKNLYIEKKDILLSNATNSMVKAIKNLMSKMIKNRPLRKRQRVKLARVMLKN